MPQAYSHLYSRSLLPNERPRCPKCQGRMMLTGSKAGPRHTDLRTFKCAKCENVQTMRVEDTLKSANARWQDSGLNAPK
jgi:tRNA(Ile2) C34 agmatinyltransferase TiaS